ncbi:hypothetical protein DM01DRAFT_1336531 [Hesseltinella vesiculosa]|uniref:Uncharacterized protein n=1 Tax=Hesseltinella vesiculosa TaxID=101127 RepID=A0A1X2GFR7_9FUNG|nr:hypothetical protein DM01DRAFT_1336531 [Hesseltinella vesiculosa]
MHSYIAYMIYTDLAKDPLGPKRKLQAMASMIKNEPHYHTQSMDQAPLLLSKNPYGLPPPSPPISQPPLSHRPLTAYLWSSPDKTRENVVLPPLASPPSSSTHL